MTNPLVDHQFGAPWTIDDLVGIADDGNRYEIVDGSLLVSPTPDTFHLRATTTLDRLLDRAAPPDLCVSAATPGVSVKDGRSYFIPDVAVFQRSVLATRIQAMNPRDVLLVVEVLSPSNAGTDLITKRHYYAEAGVPQYWIVDQDSKTLTVLRLDETGKHYREHAEVHAG